MAVTMPLVVTKEPFSGERVPVPWITPIAIGSDRMLTLMAAVEVRC